MLYFYFLCVFEGRLARPRVLVETLGLPRPEGYGCGDLSGIN
jgi:hypothetical protein